MITLLAGMFIFVIAYFLGSIPFGLIIARTQGIDIREHGSRNIGATNVWRVLGKKWGLITFILDVLKGVVAVLLAKWIAAHVFPIANQDLTFAGITAALGCIIGHTFPVWLGFKGGKGVATSLGVILGMMPLASLIVLAIWGLVFKTTRYVSLASIAGAVALPVVVMALLLLPLPNALGLHGWGNFYFACAAALLVIRRHRENITRLVEGTENRFGTPKPPISDPMEPRE
ncbi:MAG: acyl-phosphate glycerol 3-phosphate acyltransferase [Chthoniobacteraceae bacterium]|nr:acyl-phosphate glycerol 3-phosphate acyltransferase [Chthoniobacteraceae bacterium]